MTNTSVIPSIIIKHLNENSYNYRLPASVEPEIKWDAIQEHFAKGKLVSVRINVERKELVFEVNLGEDYDYMAGRHVSIPYHFSSIEHIATKLYPNITTYQIKPYKIMDGNAAIFDGEATYIEIESMVEDYRKINRDACVNVLWDFVNGKAQSFMCHMCWNEAKRQERIEV